MQFIQNFWLVEEPKPVTTFFTSSLWVIGLGYSESCARWKAVVGTRREIVTVGFNAISVRDRLLLVVYVIQSN
jgi:hypothetical protein